MLVAGDRVGQIWDVRPLGPCLCVSTEEKTSDEEIFLSETCLLFRDSIFTHSLVCLDSGRAFVNRELASSPLELRTLVWTRLV